MTLSMETVETKDGSLTLRHENGELYHSMTGAREEAKRLYVESSSYKEALTDESELCILDVGLGLGYNALSTIEAWEKSSAKCDLTLYSFEKEPELLEKFLSGKAPLAKKLGK